MGSASARDRRKGQAILVPQVETLGMIGVVRSLGRAGYEVHACSEQPNALGLRSSFARHSVICPPYSDSAFLDWLRDYVAKNNIRVVVPSEGLLEAIEPAFGEFQPLMPVPRDPGIVYRAFSKVDVAEALLSAPDELGVRQHHPPTLVLRPGDPVPPPHELVRLRLPLFVKTDFKYCRKPWGPTALRIDRADGADRLLDQMLRQNEAILVQGFVPGRKAAAAFCLSNGRVVAKSGVFGIHTNPHWGGMMSLRKTWYHEKLTERALTWLKYLEWDGVAMVECKWEPASDHFWFIELNSRYWGYLHLDLFSGIDFPRIQIDNFLGEETGPPLKQRLGVRCRHTVPGDAGYLTSLLRDGKVSRSKKAWATSRFFLDFLDPFTHSDLLFPGDRKLYWWQSWRFLKDLLRWPKKADSSSPPTRA